MFQEPIWCKFWRFENFCTLFKYFWNQVAYMAPWELNLYTYMLIFDHNMQKEWRYGVKYLLEKSFFVLLMKQKGLYTHHTSQKKDYEKIIHEL